MSDSPGLPAKPRVPRYFHLVPMGKEAIQLRGAHKTVVLSGKSVPALTKLLNLSDGRRSVDDLVAEFPDIPSDDILKTLRMLRERGVLEDAVPHPSAKPEHRDQITMFSIIYGDGEIPQDILSKSRMVAFGLGRVGSHAVLSLARAGIGWLTLVDDAPVDPSLSVTGAFYRPDDAGRPRVEVALERLSPLHPNTQLEGLGCGYKDTQAAQAMDGADLVLVCQDGPAEDVYKHVNRVALKTGVRWMRVSLDGFEAQVGPCFVPYDTACYTCLDLRSQANWTHFEENAAFQKYLLSGKVKGDYGCLAPMSGLLGNLAAMECIRLLTGVTNPITCGKLWTFNVNTFEAQSHEVLKLPRCPSCGLAPKGPTKALWEL